MNQFKIKVNRIFLVNGNEELSNFRFLLLPIVVLLVWKIWVKTKLYVTHTQHTVHKLGMRRDMETTSVRVLFLSRRQNFWSGYFHMEMQEKYEKKRKKNTLTHITKCRRIKKNLLRIGCIQKLSHESKMRTFFHEFFLLLILLLLLNL